MEDRLAALHEDLGIGCLIAGGARGADIMAEVWAHKHDIPVEIYKADWDADRRAAGPKRNARMLDEGKPDLVLAFRGGRGTENMIQQSSRHASRPNVVRMWWPGEEFHLIDTGWACAVIGFSGHKCSFAAPILAKSFVGRGRAACRDSVRKGGYRVIQS